MKKAGRSKKSAEKSRTATVSPGMRVVSRLDQAVSSARDKLTKRYEKSIRMAEKDIASLSVRLERLQNAGTSGRPVRGRKPAKNATQTLQKGIHAAQSALDQLIQGYEKMLAENKALAAFEKEWKKTGAKAIKAKIAEKAAKKAKAEQKAKTAKKSVVTKTAKPAKKAAKAAKPAKAAKTVKRNKKSISKPVEVVREPSMMSESVNLPEAEVA